MLAAIAYRSKRHIPTLCEIGTVSARSIMTGTEAMPAEPAGAPEQHAHSVSPGVDPEHIRKAWEWFDRIGRPKFHVAPMVDQSELPFRMLCRNHGATAAYTPMFHARIFTDDHTYRKDHWTTCEADRPLFVQFCANDPEYLLKAARLVEGQCDAVDLNLGCPQRIAKKGYYGAFLMDDLQLVESLVTRLAQGQSTPVSVKIRRFPDIADTVKYAQMLERAGASLIAVHGRTREQKDTTKYRADWDAIRAVKRAVSVPVLANGNIATLQDALECMEYTGADGVMSAEGLLDDPGLFEASRLEPGGAHSPMHGLALAREYLHWADKHPAPMRMVKGHLHKMIPGWLAEHNDLRMALCKTWSWGVPELLQMMDTLEARISEAGRDYPIPQESERKLKAAAAAEAKAVAIAEQQREEEALARLGVAVDGKGAVEQAGAGAGAAWGDAAGVGPAGATAAAAAAAAGAAAVADVARDERSSCGECGDYTAAAGVELVAASQVVN